MFRFGTGRPWAVTRILIFLAALVLVAAHLTGNMNALNTLFDFTPTQWLFVIVLVLLRDEPN
jgi:hypothetical protein